MAADTGGISADLGRMRGRGVGAEIAVGGVTIEAVAGAVSLCYSVEQACLVGMA